MKFRNIYDIILIDSMMKIRHKVRWNVEYADAAFSSGPRQSWILKPNFGPKPDNANYIELCY